MNKTLCNLICAFMPSRKCRHHFRAKHLVSFEDKVNQIVKRKIGGLKIEEHNRSVLYPFMFDIFQKVNMMQKEKTAWNLDAYLEQIKVPPTYLGVDSTHNYLNLLLKFDSFFHSEKAIPEDKVILCWEIRPNRGNITQLQDALKMNRDLLLIGDSFLRSINTHADQTAMPKYQKGISFTFDDLTCYFDATRPSRMEMMLNDKKLIISEEQKARARKCIDKIVKNHLTKYNSQPIFTPEIGRKGAKKVLVVDQSFGDMSILKGWGSEKVFQDMLQTAIDENPDADIIVKTHPDTMTGTKGGYYTGLVAHDNVYTQTDPINPISLIQYVDKVYVCTTQFGFEALMCGKEVHVFGMPFYAGWGLTKDRQVCERRTNKRTLEEMFYIAYIMYTYYVNPEKGCRCEIEDAMDYLLKLRDEYFAEFNIRKE